MADLVNGIAAISADGDGVTYEVTNEPIDLVRVLQTKYERVRQLLHVEEKVPSKPTASKILQSVVNNEWQETISRTQAW